MTKSVKKKHFSLLRLILLLVLVLVLASGGYYLVAHKTNTKTQPILGNANNRPYSTSAQNQANTENNIRKTSGKSAAPTLDNGPTTGTNSTTTGSAATSNSSSSVLITRAGVVGSDLQVGTEVSGVTSGSCTLNITQSGEQTVTRTETVEQQNNSYDCPVFSIPTADFPNQGTWNVSVVLNSQGTQTSNSWGQVNL